MAVVTGGSRGIGLAMARAFAGAGYQVVITGRDAVRLEAAGRVKQGSPVDTLVCDVTHPESVDSAFRRIREMCGRIDVLVNNAGIAHGLTQVEEFPVETWKQVIDTNLTGMFLVTRAALPLMNAGSSIVNNLSVAAVQPFAGMSAYNASKYGGLGFTQALREELRKKGIRVIALLAGATDTEIWQQFWPEAPREKMISAESVAQAVLHAVSAPANTTIEEIRIGPTSGVL
ncbi:MAG TPA: SDR family oxidoreductase [Terriglobales bacterium]|nr:SDR family oxidoreductase [Terriglobales bacterium]